MVEISLIIPAYNEAGIIAGTVGQLDAFMRETMPGRSFEVIVVDDGSRRHVCAAGRARHAALRVGGIRAIRPAPASAPASRRRAVPMW